MGGAYIYIDPTPSKNVSKANIDVDHVSGCAIPAMGCAPCLAGGGPWDERRSARAMGGAWYERGPALCWAGGSAWGQMAHAWGIMALPYALTASQPASTRTARVLRTPWLPCPAGFGVPDKAGQSRTKQGISLEHFANAHCHCPRTSFVQPPAMHKAGR